MLKGKKFKTALLMLGWLLILAAVAVLCMVTGIAVLWVWSKLFPGPDAGRSTFQLYYESWSAVGRVVINVLCSVGVFSAVITLYHRLLGDVPPVVEHAAPTRKALFMQAATVAFTLFALAVFSETEIAGSSHQPENVHTAIVAHRAGAEFGPENTVAALELAIQDGADMAEIDVQQTRDGELIVLHDTSFARTAGLDQPVWETDYATVQTLDAGSYYSVRFQGEPIPTLVEMLEGAKGRIRLMIELKTTGHERDLVAQTIAEIKAAGMEKQCVIASMDPNLLQESKRLAPELETVYITMLVLADTYDLDYVDGYSIETDFLDLGIVARIRVENKKVYAWTANSTGSFSTIIALGADGIVTDNIPMARLYLNLADKNHFFSRLMALLYP